MLILLSRYREIVAIQGNYPQKCCLSAMQHTQNTDAFLRFSGTARITINFAMTCLLLWPVASPRHTDICYQLNPINSDCPHSWCHSWLDDKYQPRLKPSLCGVNSSRDTVLALILPSSQSASCQFLPIGLMAARSPEKLAISDKLPGCAFLRLVMEETTTVTSKQAFGH